MKAGSIFPYVYYVDIYTESYQYIAIYWMDQGFNSGSRGNRFTIYSSQCLGETTSYRKEVTDNASGAVIYHNTTIMPAVR